MSPSQPSLIQVVNGRRPGSIPGGRDSAIGNPFDMQRDERLRDPVCDAYDAYFAAVVEDGEVPVVAADRIIQERGLALASAWKRPKRDAFMGILAALEDRQVKGIKTELQCFCAPERCHLDTVKAWLDQQLETALTIRTESVKSRHSEPSSLTELHEPGETPRPYPLLPLAIAPFPTPKKLAAPGHITRLEAPQVFVFGSNTQGRHGTGAAKQAMRFGAEYGKPKGRQGQTYAIVTKDLTRPLGQQLRSVSLNVIEAQIREFLDHAIAQPETEFLVTRFGCDLAGYDAQAIGSLWVGKNIPGNVRLPQAFLDVLLAEQPVVDLEVGMLQAAADICRGQRRGNQAMPTHILSIGSATEATPKGLDQFPGRVLRLEFDELNLPEQGLKTATRQQLESALAFGREAQQAGGRLFVHCSAGVRRSPTIGLAVLADQMSDSGQALEALARLSPNALFIGETVQLIDTVLGTRLQDQTNLTAAMGRLDPTRNMQLHPTPLPQRTDITIHSGGQTGADRGGLLGAEALGIPTQGVAPHGWLTENGADLDLRTRFGLTEGPPGKTTAETYRLRTALNVQQTDGTVVFGSVDPTRDRGSALTIALADQHGKPWIQFEVAELYEPVTAGAELREWLEEHQIGRLNVAGNRGSKHRELEALVKGVIEVSCREPFQGLTTTLTPVPCGLLFDPKVIWQAEGEAIQKLLQKMAIRASESQEQVRVYCPDDAQRQWLQSIAAALPQAREAVVITSEQHGWSTDQKSRVLCLLQGSTETKQVLETAAGMGIDCLGFDCRQRTYFSVKAEPIKAARTQAAQAEPER